MSITADDYAELLRAHTRAIWALKDGSDVDYPEAERSAMGEKASKVLAAARTAEADAARGFLPDSAPEPEGSGPFGF